MRAVSNPRTDLRVFEAVEDYLVPYGDPGIVRTGLDSLFKSSIYLPEILIGLRKVTHQPAGNHPLLYKSKTNSKREWR